jgi:hypothetical protein
MPDDNSEPTIHVDSDWKEEAAREKRKLLEQETKKRVTGGQATTDNAFVELLNLLGMQAMVSLGGYQGPGGQTMPPDLDAARQQISMIEALQRKTEGNLSDDEKRGLNELLHGLRMQYVQAAKSGGQPGGAPGPGGAGPGAGTG